MTCAATAYDLLIRCSDTGGECGACKAEPIVNAGKGDETTLQIRDGGSVNRNAKLIRNRHIVRP